MAHSFITDSGCHFWDCPHSGGKNSSPCTEKGIMNVTHAWSMESMGGLLPFVHEFSLKSSKTRKPYQIFFTVYWLTASSFHCILFHSPSTSQPHFTAFCAKGKLNTSWLLTRMEHSDISEQQAQLEVFQKGMHQMSQSCSKRFNSFHVDLNKQN